MDNRIKRLGIEKALYKRSLIVTADWKDTCALDLQNTAVIIINKDGGCDETAAYNEFIGGGRGAKFGSVVTIADSNAFKDICDNGLSGSSSFGSSILPVRPPKSSF